MPGAFCIGAELTLIGLLKFVVPVIASQWTLVGYALGVTCEVLDTIAEVWKMLGRARGLGVDSMWNALGCATELLDRWLHRIPGTGHQPRTWQSVLGAVQTVIGPEAKWTIKVGLKTATSLSLDVCHREVRFCMRQATMISC